MGDNVNKLNAALKLIDYAYSPEGTVMMSYGPEAFRKAGETFMFNGKEMPVIADATYAELWEKANGNYTNYARQFLGSTLSFMKSQAFEYQCTHEVGKEGAGKISTAIGLGTIKHPLLAVNTDNMWYTSVPTVLPTTKEDNQLLGTFTDLTEKFSTNKDGQNVLVDLIVNGFTLEGMSSPESAAATVTDTMSGAQYLEIKNFAWQDLLDYYASLN